RDQILRSVDAWRIDDHVRRAELLEEPKRVLAVVVVEPARMPELDEQLVVPDLLARPLEIVERTILVDDVRWELKQDPSELPCRSQRLERSKEPAEDLSAKLPRWALDAPALVGRRLVAEVGRQRLDLDRMACHQPESLDVHDESVRRALAPAPH